LPSVPQRHPYPGPFPKPQRPDLPGSLDPEQQNAYELLVSMLEDWGLGSLATAVLKFLQDGYTQDQISFLIQDTQEYKTRFAGNEARRAAGLAVLSPRDYLSVEAAYRQIMSSAGLPVGFYDQPSDFSEWIGKDVSPQEISSRVDMAVDAAQRLDQGTLTSFQDWYGVGANDLAAFFLDQDRALPHITKIAKAVKVGGAAYREGLAYGRERAEQLGVLAEGRNIDELVSDVAAATRSGDRLSNIYGGEDYGQADAEAEVFQSSEAARKKRQGLEDMERAAFSGSSGVGRSTLSRPKNY
jgi:hypothetical protein